MRSNLTQIPSNDTEKDTPVPRSDGKMVKFHEPGTPLVTDELIEDHAETSVVDDEIHENDDDAKECSYDPVSRQSMKKATMTAEDDNGYATPEQVTRQNTIVVEDDSEYVTPRELTKQHTIVIEDDTEYITPRELTSYGHTNEGDETEAFVVGDIGRNDAEVLGDDVTNGDV